MTHPESGVLAEFRAGLVTGRRRASIASHLEACDRCAGLSDQLGKIPALLAAAPPPVMPDDVARRLDLVLAAEAAKRDSSERTVDDSPAHRPASPGPRRRWDLRLVTQRILVPAAAVVVLAAGGFGLSRVAGSSPSSSAASGSAAAPAASVRSANGTAAASSEPPSQSGAHHAIESPLNFPVVNSGTDYQRATLAQQLEAELRRQARSAAGPQVVMPGSLKGCVQRVTQGTRPGTLALVERARFQSQPAIVIVAVSGDHDAAWVTTPGCSASSDHVLATATLPGTSAS
jgi:hypothetical protein